MLKLNGDYMVILDLHDAVFLADLRKTIAASGLPRKQEGEEEYTLCTTEMMTNAVIRWSAASQKARWKSLIAKGYVKVRYYGLPRQRWVFIDCQKIGEDIWRAKGNKGEYRPRFGSLFHPTHLPD